MSGEVLIMGRGGGNGRINAIIAVTYPAGSTCTCSNGEKILKAPDTSGKALFNVKAGTWTVACTDGSITKSATVSITDEGQSESVTLSYRLTLFDKSAETAALWDAGGPATEAIINENGITMNVGSNATFGQYGIAHLISPVDFTPYSTLVVEYNKNPTSNGRIGYSQNGQEPFTAYVDISKLETSASLPIDTATGEQNPILKASSPNSTITYTKVYLE